MTEKLLTGTLSINANKLILLFTMYVRRYILCKILYLMTAMLIMGKYFSYLTACAVSRAVMQVEKILSHLPGGKESTFLTPRSVVKVTFLPSDS